MSNVLLERAGAVALVTINRPDKLNALNVETVSELGKVLEEVRSDNSCRVVIVTGAGDRAFVAGADISEINPLSPAEAEQFAQRGQQVFNQLENLGKPVIAAVNGFALGGGCELALAASMRVAAHNAMFGLPEVTLGVIPGYGGTQRLPRLIGKGRAIEMIASGKLVNASAALEMGLVNQVVDARLVDEKGELQTDAKGRPLFDRDLFLQEVDKFARQFLKPSAAAIRIALNAVNNGLETDLVSGMQLEATLFGEVCATADMKEGTLAFLEKRTPQFKGE
ncbi:MAG: enoyl-CoA hydratase/isomerase family protein [Candidatus Delongbacteria bacterium]|nr:enoyl-CoA hydratase/isomerase family protein [bacterium]MBL7033408.1 enoyl-CoA hydratase/isomerase family protein [Candidatus Delongbacteria bacterium]